MEIYEMLSEKDKPILVIFKYKFRFHKLLANEIEKWCCTNKSCKSFVKRYNKEILISQSKFNVDDHNHEANTEQILKRQKILNGIKRKATENICERPSKLIHGGSKESGVENITTTDVNCSRKGIYEARRNILPAKPTNTQEVHDVLRSIDIETNEGVTENFSRHRYYLTDRARNVASMAKLSDVVSTLKKMAPLSLAESWDNVGLLIESNDVQQPIECVFLTNDLTEDVLDEAESVNANLIVSYHPPIFVPFKRITSNNWKSRIVSRCLGQGISIYSPHTSWDAVENGLTDWLISCFDGTVSTIKPLIVDPDFSHVATLSSFIADEKSSLNGKQISAILENHFSFDKINDYKILSHNESQLQVLCNSKILSSLNEMAKTHNLNLHANKNESLPSSVIGTGRFCQFKNEVSISTIIQKVKFHLGVNNLMIALARGSTLESTVDSAAAVAGSGASVLRGVRAGLYLTGEMSHHDVLDAVHDGVTVVLANHSNTERNYLKVFAGRLLEEMPRLTVHVSKADRDPLTFV